MDRATGHDNITDWALKQFTAHYADEIGKGKAARKITKQAIFHYCYAVLHDPLYREKYAQNLKREFPRIPFYADFWQWAAWGEALMALHIGYETVAPFALTRSDTPDDKARAAGLPPKALLRADPDSGQHHARFRNHAARHSGRGLAVQAGQPQCARLGARPVQGKETQRPHHSRAIRHLPLCRLQGKGHRPADARDHRERGDGADYAGDANESAINKHGARLDSCNVNAG